MFANCSILILIDISKFNTENVENLQEYFLVVLL